MSLLDSLKSAGADALHAGADSAYDQALTRAGVGVTPAPKPIPQGSQTSVVAGPSPVSADALHFTPSGLIGYVKANPVKGAGLVLVAVGLGYLIYKRIR